MATGAGGGGGVEREWGGGASTAGEGGSGVEEGVEGDGDRGGAGKGGSCGGMVWSRGLADRGACPIKHLCKRIEILSFSLMACPRKKSSP